MSEQLLFLDRNAVRACLAEVDTCAVVTRVLEHHARERVTLPPEGCLPWSNSEGAYCRALAMLGAIDPGEGPPLLGVKLINAAVSNPAHGRERAAGLSMVFDPETARPRALAEAGWLSAIRTAAYTMVSLRQLGPYDLPAVSVIGCGTLARAHLGLLAREFPQVVHIHLYDSVPARAQALREWTQCHHPQLTARVHGSARAAVGASSVVMTTTTTSSGYLAADWLAPGTFVAHVSLADLLPDAFVSAQGLYVDDVELVAANPQRILGQLIRDGRIAADADGAGSGFRRVLDGTLGQVLIGERSAIRPSSGHVISNPFGMSVLDVGLLSAVYEIATSQGIGQVLTLY
ncbi:ornithine cyclodeaminase [Streptomyces sp. HUCO-GS316]|uniref:ornithine cyclodeaminase n=1 Tax=Streptomyces sp. HUCO-GS316 TaxID=2692198 RepID=UPI001368C3DA|nr:ornithine cyclodeaminase [Streptomyces sp. HUCO-GS316]MXM65328.1 ornithine cyclodeaminase [Streptomyces sp. HUCO-GS316]